MNTADEIESVVEMLECAEMNCDNVASMRDFKLLPVVKKQVQTARERLESLTDTAQEEAGSPLYGAWQGRWAVTADGIPFHTGSLTVARALCVNMNLGAGAGDAPWRAVRIGAGGQPEAPKSSPVNARS